MTEQDGNLFTGLLWAIPISAVLWVLIYMLVKAVL